MIYDETEIEGGNADGESYEPCRALVIVMPVSGSHIYEVTTKMLVIVCESLVHRKVLPSPSSRPLLPPSRFLPLILLLISLPHRRAPLPPPVYLISFSFSFPSFIAASAAFLS